MVQKKTATLSAVFEFWKTVNYLRVNVNYTSALRPISLILPVTICSMRMNQDKFMYLVCVQIACGITNLIFARPINNILESCFMFRTVLWKNTSLCVKEEQRISWCRI
jgi:hypothetical protein